jgi:hypothetical protein
MGVFQIARNAWEHLHTQGVRRTARYARERISESFNDRRLGIRTAGRFSQEQLGIQNPYFVYYEPSDYRSIYKALRYLDIRPGENVFLDYGSGMGRVVIVAATFPFRKVIGVEICPQLHDAAQKNLSRAADKLRCRDVQLVRDDAARYSVPGDVTVAFFYSPFRGPVLADVLGNIRRSLVASPRRLFVIFKNTMHLDPMIDDHPWLVKRHEFRACDYDHKVVVFEGRV